MSNDTIANCEAATAARQDNTVYEMTLTAEHPVTIVSCSVETRWRRTRSAIVVLQDPGVQRYYYARSRVLEHNACICMSYKTFVGLSRTTHVISNGKPPNESTRFWALSR
jgi:hypothetical protein